MLVTATLSAQNTFTNPIGHSNASQGDIAVSVSGTFVGTITLQRSLDAGTTWSDDPAVYTTAAEFNVIPTSGAQYRAGFKTGAYTSGSAVIRML